MSSWLSSNYPIVLSTLKEKYPQSDFEYQAEEDRVLGAVSEEVGFVYSSNECPNWRAFSACSNVDSIALVFDSLIRNDQIGRRWMYDLKGSQGPCLIVDLYCLTGAGTVYVNLMTNECSEAQNPSMELKQCADRICDFASGIFSVAPFEKKLESYSQQLNWGQIMGRPIREHELDEKFRWNPIPLDQPL